MVLSWLNSALAGVSLAAVTAIYVGVGLAAALLVMVLCPLLDRNHTLHKSQDKEAAHSKGFR